MQFPEATGGLLVVRDYLRTPRGDEILEGIKSGAIAEMSFGYDPLKFDFEEVETGDGKLLVRNLREGRLYDTSDVNWGMNAATTAAKAAVPFKDTGRADEGTAWSAPNLGSFTESGWEELSEGEKQRIKAHYAWADTPLESFGDLKLPHHQASREGVGPAVWRGVAAAMGAMLGARGGVSLPDADRRAVYSHLARHYEQFDKEPPDFKLFELAVAIHELPEELKAGRVLSSRNIGRLKDALAVLNEILTAAEPPEDEEDVEKSKALTEQYLRKLAVYERDPILFSVR